MHPFMYIIKLSVHERTRRDYYIVLHSHLPIQRTTKAAACAKKLPNHEKTNSRYQVLKTTVLSPDNSQCLNTLYQKAGRKSYMQVRHGH